MRLTEKISEDSYLPKNEQVGYYTMVNKLGQLEDIEEELGVDLITLFKALRNGVYFIEEHPNIKANGNIYVVAKNNVEYSLVYEGEDRILQIRWVEYCSIQTKRFYLQDYGKTWALTKEEL